MTEAVAFDIELPGSWPKDLWQLFDEAQRGLSDGNLKPLHTLLTSGYQVPPVIRERLAKMIEGHADERYGLATEGKRRGQGSQTDENNAHSRSFMIGLYAEQRMREAGRGDFDAVVAETMAEFRVGRTTVTNAVKRVRATIAKGEADWPAGMPGSFYDYFCEAFSSNT